jgi:type IV fimbrial biogenesis protein FimT
MKLENGLTLVELLITIAVIAVVIAIGVPSLNKYAENNRSTAQVNLVSGTLSLARSEAIKRGVNVVVCSSNDTTNANPTCSGSNAWANGWIVFADSNDNGAFDSGNPNDAMLAVNNGLNGGLTMKLTENDPQNNSTTSQAQITFRANGSVKQPNNNKVFSWTAVICPGDNDVTHARAMNIFPVGSINLAPLDGTHIPLNTLKSQVTCP